MKKTILDEFMKKPLIIEVADKVKLSKEDGELDWRLGVSYKGFKCFMNETKRKLKDELVTIELCLTERSKLLKEKGRKKG